MSRVQVLETQDTQLAAWESKLFRQAKHGNMALENITNTLPGMQLSPQVQIHPILQCHLRMHCYTLQHPSTFQADFVPCPAYALRHHWLLSLQCL